MKYETVIGMEVHVELRTISKMFCSCSADHFLAPANQLVCPVCTAQPGSLPVINGRAIELTVMTGMALSCEIRNHSVFARKNYTYPDIPKGYQISQYEEPLCVGGFAEIDTEDGPKRIGIDRVHLEEDTGKLVHQGGSSLVDFNRAGVPLMEIVSDSSLRSADEAHAYVQKIRQLVRYLGASTGDMEKGAMRCEANVSIRPWGSDELGTKVEVKNLNSFRSLRGAIEYEVKRQMEVLGEGGQVRQVTMGWDEDAGATREQRSKEYADDYRYFPDPDLRDVALTDEWIDEVRSRLPELPAAVAARLLEDYDLAVRDAALLADDRSVATYFEAVVQDGIDSRAAGNWVTGEIFRLLKEDDGSIEGARVGPAELAGLLKLVQGGTINQTAAKEVLGVMWEKGGAAADIVAERGLTQISDTSELDAAVAAVIAENPDVAEKIRAGDANPIQFLMGQVMRATRGKANPKLVQESLKNQLS